MFDWLVNVIGLGVDTLAPFPKEWIGPIAERWAKHDGAEDELCAYVAMVMEEWKPMK
jgi:hypothetical protein